VHKKPSTEEIVPDMASYRYRLMLIKKSILVIIIYRTYVSNSILAL